MRSVYRQIKQKVQTDGVGSLIGGFMFHLRNNPKRFFDPLYQLIKPSWAVLECEGYSVEMTMDTAKFGGYDFRDDFESEQEILEMFLTSLQPNDVIWDVGANVGIYSCFAAAVDSSIDVLSFEPHPEIATILRKNRYRNGLNDNLIEVALSDVDGEIELTEIGYTAHTIVEGGNNDDNRTISVKTKTGDDLVETNPVPTIMKIDVEGAEVQVLDGMEQLFSRSPPRMVYVEEHNEVLRQTGESKETVREILSSYGYEIEVITERRDNTFLVARQ